MNNNVEQEYKQLLDSLPARGVKIIKKDTSWFFKALGKILWVLTLGKNKLFMTGFVTTIAKTIGVPSDFDGWSTEEKLGILKHELTHVAQYERYSVLFMLAYLFAFFPVGLAYFRYRFEREAYVVGFRELLKNNSALQKEDMVAWGVQEMTGPNYLWAWPFKKSVQRWFEENT